MNLMTYFDRHNFLPWRNLFIFRGLVHYDPDGTGGGEVYAYNVREDRLAWEFNAFKYMPGLPENEATRFALDDDRLLVFVGDTLFSIDCASGELLWKAPLVTEDCSLLSSEENTIGLFRYRDYLFARRCGNLFMYWRNSGKLILNLASYYGWFSLVVHKGALYATTRSVTRQRKSWISEPEVHTRAISAAKVVVDPEAAEGYTVIPISRRDIPEGRPVWWSLNPPDDRPTSGPKVMLQVINDLAMTPRYYSYDLSADLADSGQAYVKFWANEGCKLVLLKDNQVIFTERLQSLPPPMTGDPTNLTEFYKTGPLR
jgi:hypothetical protein